MPEENSEIFEAIANWQSFLYSGIIIKNVRYAICGQEKAGEMIRKIVSICVSLLISALLAVSPAFGEELGSITGISTQNQPRIASIGVVLIDAGDFDYPNATFQSTFWIWSVSKSQEIDALENLDVRNAVNMEIITDIEDNGQENYWHLQKIRGTFRNYWDLSKYPFDQQQLKIYLEEGSLDSNKFAYALDSKSKSYFHNPNLKGWTVEGMNIDVGTTKYESNFGDPTLEGIETSSFAAAEITVKLTRSNWTSFWRISAGAFISLALVLSSFLLSFKHITHLNARFGLLGGSAFANVISIRNVSSKTGSVPYITFIDQIHLIPMAAILFGLAITLYNLNLYNRGYNINLCYRIDKFSMIAISSFATIGLLTIFSQIGGS